MNKETLKRANALDKKIKECDEALNCFEYTYTDHEGKNPQVYNRTPRLIIDVDDLDNGREQIALPFNLSNTFIDFITREVKNQKEKSINEFKSL